jgi:hypothetical protein
MDNLIRRAQGVAAVVVASMAFGVVGTALEGSVAASAAKAQTPRALRAGAGKPKQVQEYVRVIPSDAGGAALPKFPKNTFVFLEQCKDGSRKVSHKVTANSAVQPLGKCNVGGPVKVTEEEPLQGDWEHMSLVVQKLRKATRNNNHRFVFIEQAKDTSPAPSTPAPTPNPTQPAPGGGGGGGGGGGTGNPYASGNVGVDISWPQCGTPDATPSGADFGIVGVNNGLGYSTNPCLAEEAADFPGSELNLYVNTAWNSSSSHINPNSPRTCATGDQDCLAYNYGYNAGLYAVNAAAGLGINTATRWWEDVESDATWSTDTTQNQNSLQGEHDALIASGAAEVGVYSTTVQWGDIAGGWQNNWPSWGATTWETAAEAATYCTGHEFTGGPSAMMQFLPPGEIDHNVAC